MALDPRVNAYRADLAAVSLRGKVEAARFTEGRERVAGTSVAPLRARPDENAGRETELLYGERFTVYDEKDGWSWGQADLDRYVGYVRSDALRDLPPFPTHRVGALGTPLLPAPDVKRAALGLLPMNVKLSVVAEENRFARLDNGAFVFAAHLVPADAGAPDWVAVAERFVGVPYLWGGKTYFGCDCSGLVQSALEAGRIFSPRDTDMMETSLGAAIALTESLDRLERGDLVFWKGHVGVMLDAARLLHANAFHMQVAIEPLADAAKRIAPTGGAIRSIKRLK